VAPFDKHNPEIAALGLEVRLQPGSKKTRTFNFFPRWGTVIDGDVACNDCAAHSFTLNELVAKYRSPHGSVAATGSAAVPTLNGVYSGQARDSSGPAKMTRTVSQQGETVSGSVVAMTPRGTVTFQGALSGTLTGPRLRNLSRGRPTARTLEGGRDFLGQFVTAAPRNNLGSDERLVTIRRRAAALKMLCIEPGSTSQKLLRLLDS